MLHRPRERGCNEEQDSDLRSTLRTLVFNTRSDVRASRLTDDLLNPAAFAISEMTWPYFRVLTPDAQNPEHRVAKIPDLQIAAFAGTSTSPPRPPARFAYLEGLMDAGHYRHYCQQS